MNTSLLTPQMAGVLERVRRADPLPFFAMPVADARRAYVERSEVLELPRAPVARLEDLDVPGAGGEPLGARLYATTPQGRGAPVPVVLYLHGGGFTIGGIATHDSLCRQLALRSGAAVLSVEYRLAPEHRFPAAVDDCWAVMRWLAGCQEGPPAPRDPDRQVPTAASLGLDGSRLALAGDSAGGTLAAVCAIHARDIGLPVALQVLITPGTAATDDFPSRHLFASGFLLERAGIEWFFDLYIDRHDRHDWRFAPLGTPDLEGVAPALVVLAECDPLTDEGLAYADRLRAAGVETELELVRGVTHDYIKMGRAIPEALESQALIGRRLRERLGLA